MARTLYFILGNEKNFKKHVLKNSILKCSAWILNGERGDNVFTNEALRLLEATNLPWESHSEH